MSNFDQARLNTPLIAGATSTTDQLNWTGTLIDWSTIPVGTNKVVIETLSHSWEADSFVALGVAIRITQGGANTWAAGGSVQGASGNFVLGNYQALRADGNVTFTVWYSATSTATQRRLTAIGFKA